MGAFRTSTSDRTAVGRYACLSLVAVFALTAGGCVTAGSRANHIGPSVPAYAATPEPSSGGNFAPWFEERMDLIATSAIDARVSPGLAIAVGRGADVLWTGTYGHADWILGAAPVTDRTVYDLASLTKPLSTMPLVMQLIAEGRISLDTRVSEVLPDWPSTGDRGRITVEHLLSHRSGLPAGHSSMSGDAVRERTLDLLARIPLVAKPGRQEIYSDLGMILLGLMIERVTGKPLDVLFGERIAHPLGLQETVYRPRLNGIALSRIAPTEITRDRGPIHGDVHDPIAFDMRGVAAHAGLFGSIRDVATLTAAIASGRIPGVCRELSEHFTQRHDVRDRFALGWDTPGDVSSAGDYFSADSYGHTGYTGTSMWIDPRRDVWVVLLTNRVNPSASNQRHSQLRRFVHDAVQLALEDQVAHPRVLVFGDIAIQADHPNTLRSTHTPTCR